MTQPPPPPPLGTRHPTIRRRALARAMSAATLAAVLATTGAAVRAQPAPWPSKPVRLVVNTGAGSGADVTARLLAEPLSKAFGQPFVVEFKPGANGIIGTEFVARAPADGYTLLFTYTAAHVVNPALVAKLPYDPLKDFAPVAQIGSGGNLLVVPPDLPARDLKEFVAHVAAQPPDALSYGSWGNGSGGHIAMEALKQRTGLKMRHVPYKSAPAALADVIGGHIQVAFTSLAGGLPLVQSGKLRALAVSGPYRVPQLPEVRTMTEQGVPFDLAGYYAIVAPAGTPAPIVARLNAEINRLLADPAMASARERMGFSEFPLKTPEQFGQTLRTDLEAYGAIVRAAGIRIE